MVTSLSKEKQYLRTLKKGSVNNIYTENNCSDDLKILKHLRHMKYCNRLSGIPLIKSYSLAEHCYYTGILFEFLAEQEEIKISDSEKEFVYRHDILETVTGDLMLPVKIYNENTEICWNVIENELISGDYYYLERFQDFKAKEIFTVMAWRLFKAADLLELIIFCKEEINLGNITPDLPIIIINCDKILRKIDLDTVNELLDEGFNWI